MDLSFLWNWLSPDQWSSAIRSILIGVGIMEAVKRGARIAGSDVQKLVLWFGSIAITTCAAAMHSLRATGAASLDSITLQQLLDVILFAALVGPLAPFGHWLILLKGADFLSWIIEKRTGYSLNLRELAAGSTYKPKKRVRKADGTLVEVDADTPTDHAAGDRTVVQPYSGDGGLPPPTPPPPPPGGGGEQK